MCVSDAHRGFDRTEEVKSVGRRITTLGNQIG